MIKTAFRSTLALLIMSAYPALASAGSCQPILDKINSVFETKKDACINITKTADMSKNPFMYSNKDASGCAAKLQMPGLPDFGSISGYSMCDAVKLVTGTVVGKVNSEMQNAANVAVSEVNKQSQAQAGVDVWGGNTNVGGYIEGQYNQIITPKVTP